LPAKPTSTAKASQKITSRAEARVHLKYRGSDSALEVDYVSVHDMTQRFEALYRKRFAFTMPGVPLVVESSRWK